MDTDAIVLIDNFWTPSTGHNKWNKIEIDQVDGMLNEMDEQMVVGLGALDGEDNGAGLEIVGRIKSVSDAISHRIFARKSEILLLEAGSQERAQNSAQDLIRVAASAAYRKPASATSTTYRIAT